jgi:hypothetical protein
MSIDTKPHFLPSNKSDPKIASGCASLGQIDTPGIPIVLDSQFAQRYNDRTSRSLALGTDVCPQERMTLSHAWPRLQSRQGTEIKQAWAEHLILYQWAWFMTLTFRKPVSSETAWRHYRAFFEEISDVNRNKIGWFAVLERGAATNIHVHALVTAVWPSARREWERMWYRRAGNARILEFDPSRNAVQYCVKQLSRGDTDYDFSDHLADFMIKQQPLVGSSVVPHEAEKESEPPALNDQGHITVPAVTFRTHKRGLNLNRSIRHTDSTRGNMENRVVATLQVEALSLDTQFRALWGKLRTAVRHCRKASIPFGKLCKEMQAKQVHRYIPKPGSRKSYISFEEYVFTITEGEVSRGSMYAAISLYDLTTGPNALEGDDLADMPQANACQLARLERQHLTPEIVKAAKTTSKREFPAKVQEILNEHLPPEEQRTVRINFFRKLHPRVVSKLEETIERYTLLPVVRDGDKILTLQEKAIFTICLAAEQFAGEDLRVAEKRASEESYA